jgi:uncharacterized membrane protein YtjA (UPF0391 family)
MRPSPDGRGRGTKKGSQDLLAHYKRRGAIMIRLAIISLVIAAVLAVLGFGGAAGTFVGIAKILFFIAIAIFALFLVMGLLAGKGIKNAID